MATNDRRGVSVDATDAAVSGDPNPGLAIKAPVVTATTANITLSGLQTIDSVVLVTGNRVLVKDQTSAATNGIYSASSGNWTRTTDANSNSQLTQGMQVLVSGGTTSINTIFQVTTANPIVLGTSSLTFIRTSVPSTIGTTAPLTGGGSISANPTVALSINSSLQVTGGGSLAVAALGAVSTKWISSISSSGIPQLTQPAFTDISGTAAAAQVPALPNAVTLAGSILATNVAAPSTPALAATSVYVDNVQKVLSAKNDAGTVSITVVPSSAAAGQFVTGISAAGAISFATPAGSGTVNSSTAGQIAYYPTSTSAVSGNPNITVSGTALSVAENAIGSSSSDGFILQNATIAAAGVQQWSPRFHFIGQGWKTNAAAASQTVDWIAELQPVQGAANPTANLVFSSQINGAGYTAQVTFGSGGTLNIATGFQIAGGATSGNVPRGNGTSFVASALAAADLSNGVTGAGAVVLATSPTLNTPTLGVATATSINKVTFTAPAAAATLTIANNKTLTVSNTLTFTGADATSFAFPGASDTVGGLGTAQSWTAQNIWNIASTIASATAGALDDVKVAATTTTITGNTGSPITKLAKVGIYQPTLTDASVVTVTDASSLYIDNAPAAAGSVTITNAWALRVGAGNVKFPGTGNVLGTITSGTWNGTAITAQFGGTGLATLTAHAVVLGNGTGNVGFATIGTAGRLLIDQGAAADPSFNAMSGDASITSAGAITVTKINSVDQTTAWTAYSPTVTSNSGTITTLGAVSGRSKLIGKTRFFQVVANITTNGTGATYLDFTLPSTPAAFDYFAVGQDLNLSPMVIGHIVASSAHLAVTKTDGSYPGANGSKIVLSGAYEES